MPSPPQSRRQRRADAAQGRREDVPSVSRGRARWRTRHGGTGTAGLRGGERAGEVREAQARKKKSRSVPVFGELMSSTQGGRGWRRAGDLESDPRGALGHGRLERGQLSGQGLQTFSSRPGQGGVDAFYGGQSFKAAAAARLLGF